MECGPLGNTAGMSGNLGFMCAYLHFLPRGSPHGHSGWKRSNVCKNKKGAGKESLRLFIPEEYQVIATVGTGVANETPKVVGMLTA